MPKVNSNWIIVGAITRTHGTKGELRLLPFFMDYDFIYKAQFLAFYRNENLVDTYEVASMRPHAKYILVQLKELNSIDAVKELIGTEVGVKAELVPAPDTDEFYIEDLIGVTVKTESGERIGTIRQVYQTPGNDVYEVIEDNGSELLVPATKEYVIALDLPHREIVIQRPRYL